MVLTLRGSALLSKSSSALQKRGNRSPQPVTSFSVEPPRELVQRAGHTSALIASFVEEDRQEADKTPDSDGGGRTDAASSAALKLRLAANQAKQSVHSRSQNAEHAAQHALTVGNLIGESFNQVNGDALETGEVGAVLAVVAAGGKPVPGTRWVEYVDDEEYMGTPYYYNLDTGESVWIPPEEVLASQQHKSRRLLAGMGLESFSDKARDSLVTSFIEAERKEQELEARNPRTSAARKRRIAAREAAKRREAAAEREAERKAMEELLAEEEAARPPPAAPLTSILEAAGTQNNALLQFARYLGMDPVEDQALLWIAKEAMLAPLPEGWTEVTDPTTGDVFYHCEATGQSEWAHPAEAQYKALYMQIKQGQAERLQEVGSEGVRKTWGGDLIALHKHTHTKPMTGAEIRLAQATERGYRRRREEEHRARKERNRVRKERRVARVALRVQRIWRSKRFRRQMETKGLQRAAAITLQAAGRGLITRRRVYRWLRSDLEREAATHIQRWARGYNLRRRMRGRMERLLFRRELRAKRREVTAARAANAAWYEEGGFRDRIRRGEHGVLRKWDPPWEPLDVRAAAMRIQAAWRGASGRARASDAFRQLQLDVADRLQQDAAALEIQQHWRRWRLSTAAGIPDDDNALETSSRPERFDEDDQELLKIEQSWTSTPRYENSQEDYMQQLPEADLVCARILQLQRMGVQLLWLQPESDTTMWSGKAESGIAKLTQKSGKQAGLKQQLRTCRVAETVATAEHFFKRGETETALHHMSSVHAAMERRANEIQESSLKVNEDAASEIRRSEYLSAVHCADSAAAMAMPPVLGLREAVDLTQRARGLFADQAMTANMTLRLALEDESMEAAQLDAQKGWSRRRDRRAEAFRERQHLNTTGRTKKSDRDLMAMVSMNLIGKSFDITDVDRDQRTVARNEGEKDELKCLQREAAERKKLRRATERRAVTREAEVGACEHNLALLQMLLGCPATEWQQTLERAIAAVERAEKLAKRGRAAQNLSSASTTYISKIRKTNSVLGRAARIAATAAQGKSNSDKVETGQGNSSSISVRPRTAPSGLLEARGMRAWSCQPPFDACNRRSITSSEDCSSKRVKQTTHSDTRTVPSPFAVPAYSVPEDAKSGTIQRWTSPEPSFTDGTSARSQQHVSHCIDANPIDPGPQPLCEVAANRSATALSRRKIKHVAEFAARDRRIAARAARPRTAPVARLLVKKKNAYGVEELMPDQRQLAEMERLSPRGTSALFETFLEQRENGLGIQNDDRNNCGRQKQPPPGPSRYSWTCERANGSRRESGIFKTEMSVRKQMHRDRRGRRGAALSVFT